jgi:photosystem II stability/assembly factor-like uncharacterized protein
MAELSAYTSKDGALWVLPEGPNHAPQYVGCTDADDISEPKGDIELVRCFGPDGQYQVVGSKTSPPDAVTTSLTSLTYRVRSVLEKIRCEYGLVFLQRDGGRADSFCNWQRALILTNVRNTEKTYGGIVKREEDVESTRGFAITAYPPVIDVVEVEGKQVSVDEHHDFNDVFMLKDLCTLLPLKYGVAVTDNVGGIYTSGQVWLTEDGGQSWSVTPTSPFAAALDLMACTMVDLCNGIRRIIVAEAEPTGAQAHIAYSDNEGVTWTEVHIGGGTDGHGAVKGGTLFAIDQYHIWFATAGGFIYFSADGGETWTAQDSAGIGAGDYYHIEFMPDGLHGYAGKAAGIIAKTSDGGTSWTACTVLNPASEVLTVSIRDNDYIWVGTDDGELWWTEDAGVTWTQRTGWTGSGTATVDIQDIAFVNDYVGFMITNTGGVAGKMFRTIDGGYSWTTLTIPSNAGLTSIAVGDENYVVYVGLISGGFGFMGVIEE